MPRGYDRALEQFGSGILRDATCKNIGIAAEVPGFIGFAVGRTVFWDPLVVWRSKKATREQTVAAIAKRYREFVDLFERATTRLPSELSDRTGS